MGGLGRESRHSGCEGEFKECAAKRISKSTLFSLQMERCHSTEAAVDSLKRTEPALCALLQEEMTELILTNDGTAHGDTLTVQPKHTETSSFQTDQQCYFWRP